MKEKDKKYYYILKEDNKKLKAENERLKLNIEILELILFIRKELQNGKKI